MQGSVQLGSKRLLGLRDWAIVLVLVLVQPACAETELFSLAPVVVVSSRMPSTVGQEVESLTVITREQIELMGAATGPDLLRQVPGLQIDQLGGPGGISLAYIRGSDPNHVLVLIDGVRVNDPTNSRGGGFDFSSLDPSQVERIEVLRGAASAIYGADAMGGVINVVTRKAAPGGFVSAAAGGLGYGSLNARATWLPNSESRLSISTSTLRDGLNSEGSRLALNQVAVAARASPSASSMVELDLRHVERESGAFPDDSGGIELAEIRALERRDSRATTLSLRGVADIDAWMLTLEGTGFEHRESIDSPGVAPGVRSDFGLPASKSTMRFRRSSVLVNAVKHIDGGNELAIGAEYQQERGISRSIYELFGMPIPTDFDLRRRTASAFAELKWSMARDLIVRAGLRNDAIEGNGSHVSRSIGTSYSVPQLNGQFKASYSEGFKPPSFFALGLSPALGGNPDLNAEQSKGISLGYEQHLNPISRVSLAVFQRRYSELITFDNKRNQLENADRVEVNGVEIELKLQASDFMSFQADYTRMNSQVSPSGEPLRQRPGQRAGAQLNLKLQERANLVWRLEYADEIFDSSIPTGNVFLRSYLRNDLAFIYAITKRVNATAKIENLADQNNQWYVGAPSLGRRAWIRVTLSL